MTETDFCRPIGQVYGTIFDVAMENHLNIRKDLVCLEGQKRHFF